MNKIKSVLFIATALLLGACGNQATSTQTTESATTAAPSVTEVTLPQGKETVTVKTNPKKIVTFDLGAADTIRAIGHVDAIVGMPLKTVPTYLKDLPTSIQTVGSMKEPDMEAIAALEPDLIIASGRIKDYIPQLQEIAPTVFFQIDNNDYWTSVQTNIKALASVFGSDATKEAETQLANLQKDIDAIATKNDASTEKSLALMLNENKMSVFGASSRFAFLYQTLHFKPTDAAIENSTHGQEISFEGISEINPDKIFLLNRTLAIGGDNSNADALMSNALIQGTTAAKNDAIVHLTSDLWYLSGGGLESTKLMIADVK